MTDTAHPPRFTIGDVLGTSIAITLRRFPSFFAVTALFAIGAVVLVAVAAVVFAVDLGGLGDPAQPEPGGGSLLLVPLIMIVGYGLYFWLTGAIAYGVVQDLRGHRAGAIEMLRASLPRALPLLGAGILCSIAIGLGFIAFVIPGFILAVGLAVVAPVVAVERLGVMDSIRRSWDLTRGYRWHIFGLFVLLYVVLIIVSIVIGVIAAIFVVALGPEIGSVVQIIVELALQSAYFVLLVGAASVAYHTLRRVKEGVTSSEIAQVFD